MSSCLFLKEDRKKHKQKDLVAANSQMSILNTLFIILLTAIIAVILFVIYRKTRKYHSTIYLNQQGNMVPIINEMKILKSPYVPTWWLINRHFHTVFGMRFRKRSKLTNSVRRDYITYSDKGTSVLDWFENDKMTPETPILFIVHTCCGGTREPCTNNIAEAAVNKGWRAVVFNNRGCSGAPITSSRMMSILDLGDLDCAMQHVKEQFKPTHIFMVGFSLGAYQVTQYASNRDDITAAACVSHTYNARKAEAVLHKFIQSRLYQPVIMAKLTHFAKKNAYLNNKEAENAKTMGEFDEAIWCHGLTPYKKFGELYDAISVYDKVAKLKVPTLYLGSYDDPFTNKDYMPIKEIEASQNAALVAYPEGGHVSFLCSKDANKSLIDSIIPTFFETIIQQQPQ